MTALGFRFFLARTARMSTLGRWRLEKVASGGGPDLSCLGRRLTLDESCADVPV
jgi:hypothetical protein